MPYPWPPRNGPGAQPGKYSLFCHKILLSFPAHGPKRAYVALCALYPVCAELFLPYESSADRRPAKPKPLAYYVESLQGQRNRQEYSIFCFTPSSRSSSAPPTQRPHKRQFYNKTVSPPRSHTVCEGDAWNTSEVNILVLVAQDELHLSGVSRGRKHTTEPT